MTKETYYRKVVNLADDVTRGKRVLAHITKDDIKLLCKLLRDYDYSFCERDFCQEFLISVPDNEYQEKRYHIAQQIADILRVYEIKIDETIWESKQ